MFFMSKADVHGVRAMTAAFETLAMLHHSSHRKLSSADTALPCVAGTAAGLAMVFKFALKRKMFGKNFSVVLGHFPARIGPKKVSVSQPCRF
jgi:hypothetical protein